MYDDSECEQDGSFVKLQLVRLHAIAAHSRKEHIAVTATTLMEPRITSRHGNLADFFPTFASTSSTVFDLVTSDLLVTLRSVSTDEVDWSDLTAAMRTDCRTGVSVSIFSVVFWCDRTTTVSRLALDALLDGDSTLFTTSDLRVVLDGDACSVRVSLF